MMTLVSFGAELKPQQRDRYTRGRETEQNDISLELKWTSRRRRLVGYKVASLLLQVFRSDASVTASFLALMLLLKRRGTKVAGQLVLGYIVSLGGILYSLSLILVMLNNTQNMGACHRQRYGLTPQVAGAF